MRSDSERVGIGDSDDHHTTSTDDHTVAAASDEKQPAPPPSPPPTPPPVQHDELHEDVLVITRRGIGTQEIQIGDAVEVLERKSGLGGVVEITEMWHDTNTNDGGEKGIMVRGDWRVKPASLTHHGRPCDWPKNEVVATEQTIDCDSHSIMRRVHLAHPRFNQVSSAVNDSGAYYRRLYLRSDGAYKPSLYHIYV